MIPTTEVVLIATGVGVGGIAFSWFGVCRAVRSGSSEAEAKARLNFRGALLGTPLMVAFFWAVFSLPSAALPIAEATAITIVGLLGLCLCWLAFRLSPRRYPSLVRGLRGKRPNPEKFLTQFAIANGTLGPALCLLALAMSLGVSLEFGGALLTGFTALYGAFLYQYREQ